MMMMRRETLIGLAVLGALALNTAPAVAQVEPGSQEVHVYGGEMFGDSLNTVETTFGVGWRF